MKKALIALITLVSIALNITAAIGDWKIYMAYSEPQQIQETGNYLFVQASNSLYLYNKNDQSIQTFDKTTGMSDVVVTNISWNQQAKRLVIVYDNANIDLMDLNGNIVNIPDLYNKTMSVDKTVNSITHSGKYAYLATNFGGMKIDVDMAKIIESYILDFGSRIIREGTTDLYLRSMDWKVYKCSKSSNAQDKANWQETKSWPGISLDIDNSAYDNNIELVKTLNPDSPKYNYFGFLKLHDNKLYTCNGKGWDFGEPASIQIYDLDNNEWTTFENKSIEDKYGKKYKDIMTVEVDPMDSKHLFAGNQMGLFEFYDGELTQRWYDKNSPIYSHYNVSPGNENYQVITSIKYDNECNLWIINTGSSNSTLLKLTKDNNWIIPENAVEAEKADYMKFMGFDSKGYLWMYNNVYGTAAAYRYDTKNETITEYSNFTNEDGISYSTNQGCRTLAEDKEGNIWMGLSVGLFVLTPEYQNDPTKGVYQIKVPRNDGTNLADYLLSDVDINTIAVDDANRKWIGTNGNGIYVISADNMVQEKHFTSTDSPLLSDIIQYITIDHKTGRVYIGTDKGLCSYQSEVTQTNEEMDKDNVWVYPNPVTPEYNGMINVTGLSFNSDVKITSSNGSLVAQGRSTGGSFSWDGKDLKGNRVASGVYMVQTAKSDGSKGTVCKITIIN